MEQRLETALLSALKRNGGQDGYTLMPARWMLLCHCLEQAMVGPAALEAVTRVLRIAAALDGELSSPEAAAAVRALLQSDPRAVCLARGLVVGESKLDESRAFARREGRVVALRAPTVNARAARGSIPIRSLLQNGSRHG